MSTSTIGRDSLVGHLAAASDSSAIVRVGGVVFIVALTAAAAQISFPVPLTPIPFTVQPMVVLLGGAALGWRLGAAAQVLYLLLGVAGLPVFAADPGLPPGLWRLVGPTGGYLLSYPIAAAVTGVLAERGLDRRWGSHVLSMLVGLTIVYAGGVARLAFGPPVPLGLVPALWAGVYPFVFADIVKVAVAAGILPTTWRLLGRPRRPR